MINLNVIYLFIISLVLGYLSGNIHGAYIIGKIFRDTDIREHGSGNSGTTNALRVFGFKLAILVLIIDFSKAFFPVFFATEIAGFANSIIGNYLTFGQSTEIILKVIMAFGIILGHNYPFVLKFKGGKGIACTFGILFAINYWCGIIFALLMIAIVATTRYVSLASVISAMCAPIMLWGFTNRKEYITLGLILMVFAVYRHKSNIQRLKNGTESKFGEKVKVK